MTQHTAPIPSLDTPLPTNVVAFPRRTDSRVLRPLRGVVRPPWLNKVARPSELEPVLIVAKVALAVLTAPVLQAAFLHFASAS